MILTTDKDCPAQELQVLRDGIDKNQSESVRNCDIDLKTPPIPSDLLLRYLSSFQCRQQDLGPGLKKVPVLKNAPQKLSGSAASNDRMLLSKKTCFHPHNRDKGGDRNKHIFIVSLVAHLGLTLSILHYYHGFCLYLNSSDMMLYTHKLTNIHCRYLHICKQLALSDPVAVGLGHLPIDRFQSTGQIRVVPATAITCRRPNQFATAGESCRERKKQPVKLCHHQPFESPCPRATRNAWYPME